MLPLLNQAINIYNTQYIPGGVLSPSTPNPNYPDNGDTQGYGTYNSAGYVTAITEQLAIIFAFNSLIDPSAANRVTYAQYARNLIMYALDQAALGHLSGAPFRDPLFAVYNRANGSGEQWPLIVDWIYSTTDAKGNPILTAADKAVIRKVFMMWANDCLNASTTGGDHPAPIGVTNSFQLFPGNQPYRMASNNYYLGHARLLTMMALAIDPSDDPPVNPNIPAAQLGNTLRSYLADATGAWLYQEFAMMGDQTAVATAYGIAGGGAGFGLASGGTPPEGMLYGHSFGFILGQLLALQTAGFNDVGQSGLQIGLIRAPVWDRYVDAMLSSITPTSQVFLSESYEGPLYQFASYGDLLRLWVTPEFMQPFALLTLLDHQNNSTAHDNASRWFVVTVPEGAASALMTRISQPWSWSTTQSILYYMLLDPAAPAPSDPRPTIPTIFVDREAGRIVAHSDWTSNNTMFDYRANWISINHQVGDGGQFEFFRNGEWLTKEMSNYDNNALGLTTVYHNTLALQNYCTCPGGKPANLQWYEAGEWANGSQWMLGLNAGDPITVTSSGVGYVYAASDLAKLYNRPDIWSPADSATNITQATRSILWLNNDFIVVYDRATSLNQGLFKRFNLSLVTNPVIRGSVATEQLASGQLLFIQRLLPLNAIANAVYGAGNLNPIADLEPTRFIFTDEDPGHPADTRFLHVLQGANPGGAMLPAVYLRSTGGQSFDGAEFGTMAVFFPFAAGGFSGTSLAIDGQVRTLLVTGLPPNTAFGVTNTQNAGSNLVTIAAGGTGPVSDSAGVLRLTF
jgi:hypothetical protein